MCMDSDKIGLVDIIMRHFSGLLAARPVAVYISPLIAELQRRK